MTNLRTLGMRIIIYIDDILVMAPSKELAQEHTDCHRVPDISVGEPWVHRQSTEIFDRPHTGNRIPGSRCRLRFDGAQITGFKDQEHPVRCRRQSTAPNGSAHGSGSVKTAGQVDPCNPCNEGSPPLLQTPPSMPASCLAASAGLLPALPSNKRGERGFELVGHSPNFMEREVHHSRQSRSNDRDGCLQHRLGCPVRQPAEGRTVVSHRGENAHQLPGASGSNLGNPGICQEAGKYPGSSQDGQHVCPDVHQQDGRYSLPNLNRLTKDLWTWCLARNITLRAYHLPGALNEKADEESRIMKDRSDWMLCRETFRRIQTQFGPLDIDLFASRLTKQLPTYVSWRPDPQALETDAFSMNWKGLKAYANPPWHLIIRVLCQVREQEATIVLVAPVWKTRAWYSLLLKLMIGTPLRLPRTKNLIQPTHPVNCPDIQLHLAVWRISGQDSLQRDFRLRLQASCLPHGERSLAERMTRCCKWASWCVERDIDPISADITGVVNLLADLFHQGYQHRSLCSYRSAISSVHEKVDGQPIGSHPMVSRLLKGAFHERPPQPRYSATWDVSVVTNHIVSLGDNQNLAFADLTLKLVMLLALTRPSRSMDLTNLYIRFRHYSPEGVTFQSAKLAKQSRQTKPVRDFFFPKFEQNKKLCPVLTLQEYEKRTTDKRSPKGSTQLLIAMIRPHKPVSSSTVARWLKTVPNNAGIDTSIFKAHSVRSAACSSASEAGVTTATILDAADWATETVFQRFYYKPKHNTTFGHAVLSQLSTIGNKATKSR